MKYKEKSLNIKSFPLIKRGIAFGILIVFSSCLSIKPGAAKSGKKLYETFFVGEDGTQYFIKPLIFINDINENLELDITFRYKNEIKDSAIVNVSFLSKEIFKHADSLKINHDSSATVFKEIKYMFSERKKEEYNSRFSTKGSLFDIKKLFNSNNWNIIIYKNGSFNKYITPKATKKKIDKLKYEIFMLM